MRLDGRKIDLIHSLLERELGSGSEVWLFGSRTDDSARGGDIDLYVEPAQLPKGNQFLLRQRLKRELEKQLHNAVDLVINIGHTSAFMRQAKHQGIHL